MGRLISLENLNPDPTWYFSDARYTWEGRRWVYQWPSPDFPYTVAIHEDDLKHHKDRKIAIRQWIEANLHCTVIFNELKKDYRVYYSEDRSWEHGYERTNTWIVFYFEKEEDALIFKLAFSEYVREVTDLHPTKDDKYEETSYYQAH